MRPIKVVIVAAFAFGIFVAAFWLGFREGANVGLMVDSLPRGAMALHHIAGIERGKTQNVLISLESDVDMALLWGHHLEHHPLRSVLEPAWGLPLSLSEQYLTRLADYRQQHPSPLGAEALAKEPPPQTEEQIEFRKSLLEGAKENDAIISSMVAKYATRK
jgi:hypothetical protein